MKLNFILLSCTLLLSACSNAKNDISAETLKEDLKEVTIAKIQRDSIDFEKSRRLYISAFHDVNSHSKLNDELFIYALQKMSLLWATYQVMEIDFSEDIKQAKLLSPLGIDGLCIMTKYLSKYRNNVDPKFNELITDDYNRAEQYLALYEKKLAEVNDPLSENTCLSLK